MIEVERLTKQYRSTVAVRDLTFSLSQGSTTALLGSNGAGKTTTLRMLAGVVGPTQGVVRLCGHDLITQPVQARRCLGYLPETSPLYPEMTVRQYLAYRVALKGITRSRRDASVIEACRKTGCEEALDLRISRLSKGYRQRVGLADALLANPPILLLDEPTVGLDPNQVRELRDLLIRLRDDHAIIISTHVISEVEALCTHVLVMHHGRLVANDSIESLQSDQTGVEVELQVTDPQRRATAVLTGLQWKVSPEGSPLLVQPGSSEPTAVEVRARATAGCSDPDVAIERLVAALVEAGVGVRRVNRATRDLQSVFIALTEDERATR